MTCTDCKPRWPSLSGQAPSPFAGVELCPRHAAMVDRVKELEQQLAELATDRRLFVPGVWSCAKCGFELTRTTINTHAGFFGTTAADREESEPCPNDGTEMRRVSWQDRASSLGKSLEAFFDDPTRFWPYAKQAEEVDRLTAELQEAAQIMPDPEKLNLLADWIDVRYPNDTDPQVQLDLRRWASDLLGWLTRRGRKGAAMTGGMPNDYGN